MRMRSAPVSLPSFGNDLSEDPHRVIVAHVLKVHIIHLVGKPQMCQTSHPVISHAGYFFMTKQLCRGLISVYPLVQ